MKKNINPGWILGSLYLVWMLGMSGFAVQAAETGARAAVSETVFEFGSVVEGDPVLHDFIIRNEGTEVLNILDVKTSCGCTTASTPGPVAPGQEGAIAIKFNSEGRVGAVRKTITVTTDDPQHKEISFSLQGQVERMYTMSPTSVKLTGVLGESLSETVAIVPEKKFPFQIKSISAKRGDNINYRYQEIKDKDGVRFEVIIENTRKELGPYFDTLTVETDSDRKPEIKIQIFGSIKQPADSAASAE